MSRQSTAAKQHDSSVLSVRLDEALKRRLDRLAKASERSNSWLVQDAITAYLDVQEWQVQAISDAARLADEQPGRSVPHDRVKAWVESWGSKRELRRPK